MRKNRDTPAFPTDHMFDNPSVGMTKREYFAAMAMQGILQQFSESQIELQEEFKNALNELALKVGKKGFTKRRF